jgi:broad specificity phosphatase PhoE
MILMGSGMDAPLTEKGKEQAVELGEKLSGVEFDKIFVSSNQRALDTLELSGLAEVFEADDRLREQSFGEMTGVAIVDIPKEIDAKYWEDRYRHKHVGGESLDELVKGRVGEFWERLKGLDFDCVMVLCHAGVMAVIDICVNGDVDTAIAKHTKNCEVVVYEIDN